MSYLIKLNQNFLSNNLYNYHNIMIEVKLYTLSDIKLAIEKFNSYP